MSGESLRAMILRVASTVTVVLNGGNSSKLCQPSSKATRATGSKRPEAFDTVPRPRPRSRSTVLPSSPAGAEGGGAGGRFKADSFKVDVFKADMRLTAHDSWLVTPIAKANAVT